MDLVRLRGQGPIPCALCSASGFGIFPGSLCPADGETFGMRLVESVLCVGNRANLP
jgi:hypothetical protein